MALRGELDQAQENLRSAGKQPLMDVEASEIEVLVTISRTSEASGGLKFSVLGVGIGGNVKGGEGTQTAHRIKLVLKPSVGRRIGAAGPVS